MGLPDVTVDMGLPLEAIGFIGRVGLPGGGIGDALSPGGGSGEEDGAGPGPPGFAEVGPGGPGLTAGLIGSLAMGFIGGTGPGPRVGPDAFAAFGSLLVAGAGPPAAGALGGAPGMAGILGAAATGGELLGGEEPEFEDPHPTNAHAESPANSHATRFITGLSTTKRQQPAECANECSLVNDERLHRLA